MTHPLSSRTLPAEWTPEHVALRDQLTAMGLDVREAHPEWLEIRTLVEDVDGSIVGLTASRQPRVVAPSACTCGVNS